MVKEVSDENRKQEYIQNKEKLKTLEHRNNELDILITKLYETFALSKISEKHYNRLIETYSKEQTEIEETLKIIQDEISKYNDEKVNTEKFLTMIKKYTDFEELTTPMLNEYIDKIIVYNGSGRGKDRKQQLDIYFNFIDNYVMEKNI